MANKSSEIAEKLIKNGYQPIPIPKGQKGLRLKGWQASKFTPTDFGDDANIGIRCGDNRVAAIDIDITDATMAAEAVAELERRHKATWMVRTGQAPKCLLPFRYSIDGQRKSKVELGDVGAIEVLATGQQFVAFGLHPAGHQYAWDNDFDPTDGFLGRVDDLPELTPEEIADFLAWAKNRFVPEPEQKLTEMAAPKAPPSGFQFDTGAGFGDDRPCAAEVREILSHIDADIGYDDWLKVLMGIHDWGGGSGEALTIADTWSASGSKYKTGEVEEKWPSFTAGGGTSWASVPAIARTHGADLSDIARKHKAARTVAEAAGASGERTTETPGVNWDKWAKKWDKLDADKLTPKSEPAPTGDPVDLWGNFDPPELPDGLLPQVIEEFAHANGAQMGADPAGLAMAALVTCAAAIPDKVQIKVKRHDDWCESARLWAALIGPPSAKKSPIIATATGPLCRLDMEMMRDWQEKLKKWKATPEEKRPPSPLQTRLRIEDATVEATQQVLEGSPWGVLLLQDELSGFFGQMDRYNGSKGAQADRAFWLRSFNGGQFALNRVGRGAAIINNLSISMLGGIQPEPIRKVAGDAVDDGLLQRLFPIMLRNATMGRDEPMPPIKAKYRSLIEKLRKLESPGFLGARKLEFDDGAQAIRRELEAKHLELQSLEAINRKLASHIGKFDGLFARLCVVWHCVEFIEKRDLKHAIEGLPFTSDAIEGLPFTVTESTAQRVAAFLHDFLLGHAIAFYSGVLGLSDDHDRLTAIAGHILTHKLERVTNRDVQRGDRTMRGLKEFEIRPLLEQLAALGWLDRIDPPKPSSPPHWQVNPAVHQKFADRADAEERRRSAVRENIQRLVRK